MRISFVILHYLTERDTTECIESILRNVNYNDYNIIVVDNGSSNESGKNLKLRYQNNPKVDILLSEKNLGFARGNNLGFIKAKKEYHSDFIILMNNDMIIEQQDFLKIVVSKFNTMNFAVMGPNIISTIDKKHQNPQPFRIKTKKDAWYQFTRHLVLLMLNYARLEPLIKNILKTIKQDVSFVSKHTKELTNVQLHGSCLIFSPLYIQMFDGLYEKTFMYFEEDILFYLCRKFNLKTYYCPDLVILHKEDSATNEYLKNTLQKNRFIYRHSLASIKHLINLMK
jgi:GT2 family glycosyltransferase